MQPKVNLVKYYLSLALALNASSTFAEAKFDGLNASLGLGIYNADSVYSNSESYFDVSGNPMPNSFSKNTSTMFGDVSLGYSHKLQNNFNLAGSLFYSFGSLDQNYHNAAAVDVSGNTIIDTKFKLRDLGGISIEPGYYFTDNLLGYFKLGYAVTSVKANASGYVESVNYNFNNPGGFLYGIGAKYGITNNIFVGADLYKIDFGTNEITNSPHFTSPADLKIKLDVNYFGLKAGYTFK